MRGTLQLLAQPLLHQFTQWLPQVGGPLLGFDQQGILNLDCDFHITSRQQAPVILRQHDKRC